MCNKFPIFILLYRKVLTAIERSRRAVTWSPRRVWDSTLRSTLLRITFDRLFQNESLAYEIPTAYSLRFWGWENTVCNAMVVCCLPQEAVYLWLPRTAYNNISRDVMAPRLLHICVLSARLHHSLTDAFFVITPFANRLGLLCRMYTVPVQT